MEYLDLDTPRTLKESTSFKLYKKQLNMDALRIVVPILVIEDVHIHVLFVTL